MSLGRTMGQSLTGGLVLGLVGPLGAGKTQLVKGIAMGNAVVDVRQVTSPTFTLLQEYAGRLTLFHLDAYRLPNAAALAALGFDELIRTDSVVIVEWADRADAILPSQRVHVEITPINEYERTFAFVATGQPAVNWLVGLQTSLKDLMIRS